MRAIDKFILHVVHNLFPLNEYSEKEINKLMTQFKEEAEDLNIQVSDEQLRKYIERFDDLKNNPKVTDKDLRKYSLSKLIKLVTSMPGAELSGEEEKEDDTPDVVYNDNGITIWNGAKQGNCITYGAGERWCITRPGGSYWGQYRYGSTYKYPTFYLAKNTNLSDSDKLSFVALQVLDNGEYKFTNRENSPGLGMEGPFSWEELNNRIPWLRDIPNLKNILKYIPFSQSEKEREIYRINPLSIKQWMKEPFSVKKQYLVIRSGDQQLFSDISNDTFLSKYLPQYPQIASAIAGTTGIIKVDKLIQYIDKFSKQDQLSIVKQIRDKFDLDIFDKDVMFDLKKYLVKTNKINLKLNQRLYVTKDGQAIILLTLEDNIKVGLYTEEDDYPNIKLNKRTSKYLLDYPELDKIPLKNLIQLSEKDIIDPSVVEKVLDNAKKDSNSALVVKPIESGEIILDSNTFSSYKVDKNGKITSVPFDNEEVQQAFNDAKDNEGFQQNALSLFVDSEDEIPATIGKDALISVINAIPYNQRTLQYGGTLANTLGVVLTTDGTKPFLVMPATLDPQQQRTLADFGNGREWRMRGQSNNLDASQWASYFAYLRATNQTFNANGLKTILGNQGWQMNSQSKKDFIASNPPIEDASPLKTAMNGNTALLINVPNPRESFKISDNSGKLVKANIPNALARQLTGQGQPADAAAAAGRRGRPAGQPNAPRPQQPAAPAAQGNINVGARMQENGLETGYLALPRSIRDAINVINATTTPIINNRGASRRQNILGNAGRVTSVLEVGPSTIYFIQLGNNTRVASIVKQPGNSHYLITAQSSYQLESPSQLLTALQQRNLAEVHQYLVNEYMERNPEHLNEFKELLRKHINEKKK